MSRKTVVVDLTVRATLSVEEGQEDCISEILNETGVYLNTPDVAKDEDTEITNYEIVETK